MEEKLPNLLTITVRDIIELAKEIHEGAELPLRNYSVKWLEPLPENPPFYNHKNKERTEPCFLLLWDKLKERIILSESFIRLNSCIKENSTNIIFLNDLRRGDIIDSLGENLVNEYFNEAAKLSLDDSLIAKICKEFIDDLSSDCAAINATFQVSGFNAELHFELEDGISFRSINIDDINSYGRVCSYPNRRNINLNTNDWICEIEQSFNKNEWNRANRLQENIHDVATALSLAIEGNTSFNLLIQTAKSPYFRYIKMIAALPVNSSMNGSPINLTADAITNFQNIYKKLKQIKSTEKYKYIEYPLRRLRDSSNRTMPEDNFVDCIIGLESLLLKGDKSEIRYKFTQRGAILLSEKFGSVVERQKLLKKLYDTRSKILHGSNEKYELNITEAENALKEIIRWHLDTEIDHIDIIKKIDEAMIIDRNKIK